MKYNHGIRHSGLCDYNISTFEHADFQTFRHSDKFNMKTTLISVVLILLVIGCTTRQQGNGVPDDLDDKSVVRTESSVVHESLEAIWKFDFNQQTEAYEVTQLRSVDKETLTGETLEKIINKAWPKVQIKFIRTSNDTAYITIADSKVLTQQMGSAGAESFMISTTFSFTELKGIHFVSFDFEEGDHAIPGVYNRNSWDENKITVIFLKKFS
jgi:hypothetical protein